MPSPPPTPFDDLEPFTVLCATDIAERLHIDPRSVRRAIARGELRASRTCGLRVLAADAAEWWRAKAVTTMPAEVPSRTSERPQRRRRFERTLARLPLPSRAEGA